MAIDASGKFLGYGVGDSDPDVARNHPNWHACTLINQKLHDKYQWARDLGIELGDTITDIGGQCIAEFQRRTGIPAVVDKDGKPVADYRTRVRLGSYPPPPPPRHACLTFRGTGGIVGLDYTSRVAQACSAVVEEVPILYPASMGGIPVGATGDINAPSGNDCVDIAVDMAVDWIESTTRTFVLDGYSLGAIAASQVRAMLLPGGRLEKHADRYVCGVTFGNPSRRFGHTFYLGSIPNGEGISDFHLPEAACTWDWCDLVQPGDMYANTPLGDVGDVIHEVYKIIMGTTVSDPLGTLQKMIPEFLKLLDEAGVQLPLNIPGIVTGALAGLLAALLPAEFTKLLGVGSNETAAAVQAAIVALKFFASQPPTAAHITYEFAEAIPGMTYLDLAVQHVNYWAGQKPVVE